jgi:Carboxypeptidase regulatory-like domain
MVRFLLIAMLCAGAGAYGYGQSAVDGAIGGTVQDSSGLPIPKATVTIRNNATNAEQTVVTDDSGFFRAIHLQPSTYTVTVTAAGFESFKSPEVIVQVGLLTDLSPKLPLGSATQTVEVTSEAPALNTTSPDFANVINQRALQDLPVNNYRWSAYALLTPGVVADANGLRIFWVSAHDAY